MTITEVRVKLVGNQSERVRAFCSVTLDHDFVVRDLKVIDGTNGLFVAMPSRKLADHCPKCGSKNHMRARYCNNCGGHLNENRAGRDAKGRKKLHADIAHPINAECRQRLQTAVVDAFNEEFEKSKQPGYVPQRFDGDDDYEGSDYTELVDQLKETMVSKRRGSRDRVDEPEQPAPLPEQGSQSPEPEEQATPVASPDPPRRPPAKPRAETPKAVVSRQDAKPEPADSDDAFAAGIM